MSDSAATSKRDLASIEPFAIEPGGAVRRRDPVLPRQNLPQVECAFCGSHDTEPSSIYGCHMLLAQYFCRSCRTTFNWVREEWDTGTG